MKNNSKNGKKYGGRRKDASMVKIQNQNNNQIVVEDPNDEKDEIADYINHCYTE